VLETTKTPLAVAIFERDKMGHQAALDDFRNWLFRDAA